MTQQDKNNILTAITLIFLSLTYPSNKNNRNVALGHLNNFFAALRSKKTNNSYYEELISNINLNCNFSDSNNLLITTYYKQLLQLAKQRLGNMFIKLLPENTKITRNVFDFIELEFNKDQTEQPLTVVNILKKSKIIFETKDDALNQNFSSATHEIQQASHTLITQTKYARIKYFSEHMQSIQSLLTRFIPTTIKSNTPDAKALLSSVIHFLNLCGFIEPNTIASFLELNEKQKTILQPIMQQQKDISQHWLILPPNNSEPHPEVETPTGVKSQEKGNSYKQTLRIIAEEVSNKEVETENSGEPAASLKNDANAPVPSGHSRKRHKPVVNSDRSRELEELLKRLPKITEAESTGPAP